MKFEFETMMATRIKVELSHDVDEYAKDFLAIYNNVKNERSLLKMYNDYHNGVYVICEDDVADSAVEFLRQFGKIVRKEKVEVIRPVCCNYNYSDDYDTEFLEVEE